MKYLLSFLTALYATLLSAQTAPDYNQVLAHVFTHYQLYLSGNYYTLAHTPNGWFLDEYKYGQYASFPGLDNPAHSYQIWHKDSTYKVANTLKKYTAPQAPEDVDPDIKAQYDRMIMDSSMYSKNLYYGYSGWDWDIIRTLQAETKISIKNREHLARAYSNYAMGFLYNQYGYMANPDNIYRTPKATGARYERNRIDSFLYYGSKAVQQYETICRQAPDYITPVGNILYKYLNEKVDMALKLSIIGYADAIGDLLSGISYPDTFTAKYAAITKPSDRAKIVVTYGDNETYYLYYTTRKQPGINAAIINYNLLSSAPYLKYLNKLYPNVVTTFPEETYTLQDFINIYSYAFDKTEISWKEFTATLYQNQAKPGFYGNKLPDITMKLRRHSIPVARGRSYFLLNQFALWDILYENADQYDVYLTAHPEYYELPHNIFTAAPENNNLYLLK